jgi:hypothetical protein
MGVVRMMAERQLSEEVQLGAVGSKLKYRLMSKFELEIL